MGRGAHHDWQTLPDGWDNHAFANAPPAHLGDLKAGQALQKAVSQMTLTEKLGGAMWQAKDYVGPEAKDLIDQLTTPEASGQLVMIEIVYGISLFFGVGEVVTGLIIIAGVIFVGEVVLDILESLVAFVTTAKDATTQTQLTAAAKHFAHALTLGLAIVAALLLRKAVRRLPIQTGMTPRPGMTVVRKGGIGGGKRKLPAGEVKPLEPVKPGEPGKPPAPRTEVDLKRTGHIFRKKEGYLDDTPANRKRLKDVANDPKTKLGTDKRGNGWYAETQPDSSQVWV